MNYFEVFGLKPTYAIDLDALETQYHHLQKKWHPDLFPAGVMAQKAEDKFQEITTAFLTLHCNIARAEYLLRLFGYTHEQQQPSSEVLDEQFELREKLELAILNKDPVTIQDLFAQSEEAISRYVNILRGLFANFTNEVEYIQEYISILQYWHKFQKELIHAQMKLDEEEDQCHH